MIEDLKNIVYKNNKEYYYNFLLNKMLPKQYHISIVIPVRNRLSFLKPLILTLKNAIKKSGNKINITIVEHSTESIFKKDCKEMNIGYYWIKADVNEPFNKCLCHNIGAILNKNSNYYLFHDLDCLVYDDFFNNINKTLINKKALAIQTFKDRRVLYLNNELTNKIITNDLTVNDISIDDELIIKSDIGAPGGSIMVNGDLFFNIGGYDPELFFGYSPEDRFFWNKLELFTSIHSSTNEVLHMFHERMDETNNYLKEMNDILANFNNTTDNDKMDYINFKKDLILKYKKI